MTNEQQRMLPGVQVRVTMPAPEHQAYKNQIGHIDDVRDFGEHRFCLVVLERGGGEQSFEATELEIVKGR
jgi:hypothetical protein